MNSKLFILLLTITISLFASACSKSGADADKAKEVVLNDKKTSNREVFLDDRALNDQSKQLSTVTKSSKEADRKLFDGSVVQTMYDGYGNKTESRYFKGNPRLRLVILRTSADGKKEVTVYGYGKDTKMIPELGETAMTASGDEIANSADFYKTRSYTPNRNFMKKKGFSSTTTTLQPLPSSQFPVRQQTIQPVSLSQQPIR